MYMCKSEWYDKNQQAAEPSVETDVVYKFMKKKKKRHFTWMGDKEKICADMSKNKQ